MEGTQFKMKNVTQKVWLYGTGVVSLRKTDIILASFPKSGNTWIRFFFCNLIAMNEVGDTTIDFKKLDAMMPELGVTSLLPPWPYKSIPRIVKTHLAHWPFFAGKRSIFVVRDPRDVMVSFFHFEMAMKKPRFEGTFSEFLRHPRFGLEAWFKHFESWHQHCDVMIHYENLRKDDVQEFSKMLSTLGLALPSTLVMAAIEKSRFENIQQMEKKYGSPKPDVFNADATFARKGKSGSWKDYFCDDDLALYERMKSKYHVSLY